MSSIAQRVAAFLDSSPLTQRELGERIDLDPTKLSKSLRERRSFTAGELSAISHALDVDLAWLVEGRPGQRSVLVVETDASEPPADRTAPDAFREQIANLEIAYEQADLPPDGCLDGLRAQLGISHLGLDHPPTAAELDRLGDHLTGRWERFLADGRDPVLDLDAFLSDVAGVDLAVLDVPTGGPVRAQALRIAGRPVIALGRTGAWEQAVPAILDQLLHLLLGHETWRGDRRGERSPATDAAVADLVTGMLLPEGTVREAGLGEPPTTDELADLLWRLGVGPDLWRSRTTERGPDTEEATIDPAAISLAWELAHGGLRRRSTLAPTFPSALITRHADLVRAGDLHGDTLAWMLGTPVDGRPQGGDASAGEPDPSGLLEELGVSR